MRLQWLWLAALSLALTPACAGEARRVLVFGDSNSWGWRPVPEAFPSTRYPDAVRWPGAMAAALGSDVTVVVDGLNGRAADRDLGDLTKAIVRELPLDLVIIMLGTNDLPPDRARKPAAIVEDLIRMAMFVRGASHILATDYRAPQVLLIAPAAVGDASKTPMRETFGSVSEKSRLLARAIMAVARQEGIAAFDANSVIDAPGIDGVHLTAANHEALGRAVARTVAGLLAAR